ncbi:TetR/AcrR family transcriptional regulator [Chitiniphilus eburneus]|uniref:TetR/AcrR family transcriptional regulator n=1 Tax=Chitiniphilus eburneus TaxID=2571148 RepID=A0A4U0PTG1_9NEIS|nr:TetR/AcrR family transcriptional regulator [Chitiniphilus eburneus]TJZ71691.1 TetR/AcrR family transcriptional regulator [Chitiniphilus eburneus]
MPHCPIAKRWSRRKAARPQEILEAALDVFAEKGYAAAKVEDIARHAGVTRGTPYLYFKNKEEIFAALIRELLLPKIAFGHSLMAEPGLTASQRLGKLVRTWWAEVGATRLSALPKLMIAEARNFPDVAQLYHDEFIAPGQALMQRVLEEGIASGEFRPVAADLAVHVISAPIVMLMIWQHTFAPCCVGQEVDPQLYLETLLDLLLRGLSSTPPSA